MTKKITLTRGMVTLVDDCDFAELNRYKWHAAKSSTHFYAARKEYPIEKYIAMHSQIMNPPIGMYVDHINGDSLDNRRRNLRICTASQNSCNMRTPSHNKSGYKGVHYSRCAKKWQAGLRVNGKTKYLGLYENATDAAIAYNEAATKYYGEFARLNSINALVIAGQRSKEEQEK
jgi:hypothetical protein